MITYGEGRTRVWLKTELMGEDRLYILGGGEKPHIGSVVIRGFNKHDQTVTFGNHKDHVVLEPLAERAAEKYGTNAVAIGGVHIDDASPEEIETIVKNCKELIKCI